MTLRTSLRLLALTTLAAGTTPVTRAVAQVYTATLMGIVADTNKMPIEDAEVISLKTSKRATTNKDGIFVLAGLPPGDDQIRVRRIGYEPQTFSATFAVGATLQIGVMLAGSTTVLPEIAVVARGKEYKGLMAGFADRMLHSGAPPSSFVTREDLDAWNMTRILDVVARAGMKTRLDNQGKRVVQCPRGYTSNVPPIPVIYLNGARVLGNFDIDNLSIEQVEAMEVYKSPIHTPSQFNRDAQCVIVIWTRGSG